VAGDRVRVDAEAQQVQSVVESDSHTVLFHSILVKPKMSLTRMCSAPCSRSIRATSDATRRDEMIDSDRDTAPPGRSTSAAVSSIVPGDSSRR
jgi:hypothetical protein